MTWRKDLSDLVRLCAEDGQTLSRVHLRRGDARPLLLWFKPATPTAYGSIKLAYEKPAEGWKLASEQGKGLGAGVPWSKYYDWVRAHAERLPILKGQA